jgi:Peptidase family M48
MRHPLFSPQTQAAYLALNYVAFLIVLVSASYLRFSGANWFAVCALAAGLSLAVVYVLTRMLNYRLATSPAPERIREQLRSHFPETAASVEFRIVPDREARAISLFSRSACLIPNHLRDLLVSDDPDNIRSERAFAIIAHELGHIKYGDPVRFDISVLFLSFAVFFSIALLIAAWSLTVPVSAVFGIVFLFLCYAVILYGVVRLREFYADQFAGQIFSSKAIDDLLTKAALAEKYIRRGWSYWLTHPSFAVRLRVYRNFFEVYDCDIYKSSVLAFCTVFLGSVVGPMAAGEELGIIGAVVVTLCSSIIWYFCVFQLVSQGTLCGSLSGQRIGLYGLSSGVLFYLVGELAGKMLLGEGPIETHLHEGLSSTLFWLTPVIDMMMMYFVFWFFSREIICYRGAKSMTGRLLRRLFILGSLGSLCAGGAATQIPLLIGVFQDNFEETYGINPMGALLSLVFFLTTFSAILLYWRSWVYKQAKAAVQGQVLFKTEPLFLPTEWQPVVAR